MHRPKGQKQPERAFHHNSIFWEVFYGRSKTNFLNSQQLPSPESHSVFRISHQKVYSPQLCWQGHIGALLTTVRGLAHPLLNCHLITLTLSGISRQLSNMLDIFLSGLLCEQLSRWKLDRITRDVLYVVSSRTTHNRRVPIMVPSVFSNS